MLGAGIYTLNNTALGQLVIHDTSSSVAAKTLTIVGPGASSTTIEASTSKGWTDRIFEIVSMPGAGETVVFQGFSIAGGYATGGGILGGSMALGGGVLIDGGKVSMTNVSLFDNQAVGAAGGDGKNGNNGTGGAGGAGTAGEEARGGGIYLASGSLTLSGDVVSNNSAVGGAGGHGGAGGTGGSYTEITPSGSSVYNSNYNPFDSSRHGR